MNNEAMAAKMAERMWGKFAGGKPTITITQETMKNVLTAMLDVFYVPKTDAAPELLDALRPFIEIWSKGGHNYSERMAKYWNYDRLNAARAAIAKAEGGEG